MKHTILLLEDNEDRVRAFKEAIALLGPEFKFRILHDAPTMVKECYRFLEDACLISLDHDLNPLSEESPDPGTGLEVAEFLAKKQPVCPIILHTSNHERRWSMHNEFRFAGWTVEIVPPIGEDWIEKSWLPKARVLIGA